MIGGNHFAGYLLHFKDVFAFSSEFRCHYLSNGEGDHSGPVCVPNELFLGRCTIRRGIIRAYAKNSNFKWNILISMLNLYLACVIYTKFHKRSRIPRGFKICYSRVCLKFTAYRHHLLIVREDEQLLSGIKCV